MKPKYTTSTKQGRRFSQVMRCHHGEVCAILDNNGSSLLPLVLKFCEKGLIDERTRNEIDHKNAYEGANIMMKYLRMKVEHSPNIFQTVLEVFGEVDVLERVVEKMKEGIYVHVESEGMVNMNVYNTEIYMWLLMS